MEQPSSPTSGVGGFIDSTLYTLESGFDFFAREMAYALVSDHPQANLRHTADGDATDDSTHGGGNDSSVTGNDSLQGKVVISRAVLLDDDDITFNDETRQDSKDNDGVFRPDPFDARKLDTELYADLVRMGTENYLMDTSSSSWGGNVRQRIREFEAAKKSSLDITSTKPRIITKTKYRTKPMPESMFLKTPKGMSQTVVKAALRLDEATNTLEEVKERRTAIEQQHALLQKKLESQKQKNKSRQAKEVRDKQNLRNVSVEPDEYEVELNPYIETTTRKKPEEEAYEEKLKALERRYNEIQKTKDRRKKEIEARGDRSKELTELQAEMDRLAVEDIFANLPSSKERYAKLNLDGKKSIPMLGLAADPTVSPFERKRQLNSSAHDQLFQMMEEQVHLEKLQKVVARDTNPPAPAETRQEPEQERQNVYPTLSVEEEHLVHELESLLSDEGL